MTERDWELYRLSVVAKLPDSPFKCATIAGIKHKLHLFDKLDLSGQRVLARPKRPLLPER
jgi:hypothetical protein